MAFFEKTSFPAEFQLLTHCLCLGNKGYTITPDKAILDAVNWSEFLTLADQRHRVLGIICKNHVSCGGKFIPEKILTRISHRTRSEHLRMLHLTAELIRMNERLKTRGIRVIAYKGPVLGIQLFGTPGIRRSKDIDIVVPKASIQEAKNIILASGYEPRVPSYDYPPRQTERFFKTSQHFNFFHPHKGITLELHWKFFAHYLCAIDFETVWKNRQPVKIGDSILLACSPEDTLILLLLHGGKHGFNRLFWLYDLRLLLNDFDQKEWLRLMDRIQALNIERPAYYAFFLMEYLLGMSLPQNIRKQLAKDKNISLLVRLTLDSLMVPQPRDQILLTPLRALLFRLLFVPHFQYRIKVLTAIFFVWDLEFFPLPDRLRFLYYPLRPFLWFFRRILKIRPATTRTF